MEFLLGFGIGMSVGSCVGLMAAAMLRMSKEGDRQLDLTKIDQSATFGEDAPPHDGRDFCQEQGDAVAPSTRCA